MSNAMRLGKRSLAAAAAGAIGFAGLTFMTAPSAQGAGVVSVYSASDDGTGVAGSAGIPGDPSSVVPDSSADSGDSSNPSLVTIYTSAFRNGNPPVSPLGNDANYVILSVDGANASLVCGPTAWGVCNGTNTQMTIDASTSSRWTADDSLAQVQLVEPGTVTVTVRFSWAQSGTPPTTGNTWTEGTFTIQSLGAPGGAIFTPLYRSVANVSEQPSAYNPGKTNSTAVPNIDDSTGASLVLVQVSDSNGAILPISEGQVLVSGATAGSSIDTYVKTEVTSADCTKGALNPNLNPGNQAASLPFANACSALAKGNGVIVMSKFPQAYGQWSIQVTALTPGGTPVGTTTHEYAIASQRGASYAAALDSAAYVPGSPAVLTYTVSDFGGRPVADGIWARTWQDDSAATVGSKIRPVGVQANAAVIFTGSGTPVSNWTNQLSTYNGSAAFRFTVPERAMLFTMAMASGAAGNGTLPWYAWATSGGSLARSVSAQIGEPEPVVKEIVIVGSRGLGDDANRVYVEGRTTNLVGETVTPYYRFPGETGFSAGTGVRTVDTDGNFSWQRKTGKKIAVQFRGEGEISNTVIIEAK